MGIGPELVAQALAQGVMATVEKMAAGGSIVRVRSQRFRRESAVRRPALIVFGSPFPSIARDGGDRRRPSYGSIDPLRRSPSAQYHAPNTSDLLG
jgi:hypothetical protein